MSFPAARLTDEQIRYMGTEALAQIIHRFGPPLGIQEPPFIRQPKEHEVGQMREIATVIRDRALAR